MRAGRSPTRTPQSQSKGRSKSTDRTLEAALRVANEEREFYKQEYLNLVRATSTCSYNIKIDKLTKLFNILTSHKS